MRYLTIPAAIVAFFIFTIAQAQNLPAPGGASVWILFLGFNGSDRQTPMLLSVYDSRALCERAMHRIEEARNLPRTSVWCTQRTVESEAAK